MPASSQTLGYAASPATREAPIPAHVAERAIEWLVDLQAQEVAPALLDDWKRWRTAHPDHERAWQRIEAVNGRAFGKLRDLAAPLKSGIAQAALTPPRSLARRNAITTLAVLLFAGGGAWMAREEAGWSGLAADHRTATGERRKLMLDDGTALVLNSGSAIKVYFSSSERRVRLLEGEVYITTAKDAARPFLVETRQGEAQALGTRYTVRQDGESAEVAVYEGAVRITPRRAGAQARVLQASEQARFTLDSVTQPAPADPDRSAWTQGFIVARGMRLGDFVAELNRHSLHPLSCDPRVADLRISGSYPLADIDKVLDSLGAMLSLRVEIVPRFWGLQTARMRLVPRQAERGAGSRPG